MRLIGWVIAYLGAIFFLVAAVVLGAFRDAATLAERNYPEYWVILNVTVIILFGMFLVLFYLKDRYPQLLINFVVWTGYALPFALLAAVLWEAENGAVFILSTLLKITERDLGRSRTLVNVTLEHWVVFFSLMVCIYKIILLLGIVSKPSPKWETGYAKHGGGDMRKLMFVALFFLSIFTLLYTLAVYLLAHVAALAAHEGNVSWRELPYGEMLSALIFSSDALGRGDALGMVKFYPLLFWGVPWLYLLRYGLNTNAVRAAFFACVFCCVASTVYFFFLYLKTMMSASSHLAFEDFMEHNLPLALALWLFWVLAAVTVRYTNMMLEVSGERVSHSAH